MDDIGRSSVLSLSTSLTSRVIGLWLMIIAPVWLVYAMWRQSWAFSNEACNDSMKAAGTGLSILSCCQCPTMKSTEIDGVYSKSSSTGLQ